MPLRFVDRVIQHLAHDSYEPVKVDVIARQLRVDDDDRELFDAAVEQLVTDGRAQRGRGDRLVLPEYPGEVVGEFRLNPRGFGFLLPDQPYRGGDLFVPEGNTRDAISGDRVRASVIRQERRARPGRSGCVGRVVEVLERGRTNFVGTLLKRTDGWFVEPDGRSLHEAVLIRDPHARDAKAGDKVVIELLHYPDEHYVAEGVITRVLGEAGAPDVETAAVIAAHGLRTDFPDAVTDQARRATTRFDDAADGPWPDREDLTGSYIFTIDPPDAKDFDDAISIEYDADAEEWTLGVHIADVSTFVDAGSELDEEARARGNSAYLPRLVLPMLPEILSNGVCSLQEGVPRFAKSAFITYDAKGRVIGQRFSSSVIRSVKRLTYLEAQALIDGDQSEARRHARTEPRYDDRLVETLRRSDELARVLRARRLSDGMMVLNLPEVELVFDDDGHVQDAVPEDDAFTHTIIEMFMVEANEAVARLFCDLAVPLLRRIHPEPNFADLEELQLFARAAHYDLPDHPTRRDISDLLIATRDAPAAKAIHFAVLRTFTKATYSPAMIGHFGLASEHYAHFTSPIRRYPDLSVHRALQAYLDATDNGRDRTGGRRRQKLGGDLRADDRVLDEGSLVSLGRHCSDTELEAEKAERELREFLVLQFLHEHHLGDVFKGVVTGVRRTGVFIALEKFLVDGLVPTDDLPGSQGGRWTINENSGRLVAPRGGGSIGVGDVVEAKIVAIDLATRHLDLGLERLPEHDPAPPASKGGRKGGAKGKSGGAPGGKPKGHAKGKSKKRKGGRRR